MTFIVDCETGVAAGVNWVSDSATFIIAGARCITDGAMPIFGGGLESIGCHEIKSLGGRLDVLRYDDHLDMLAFHDIWINEELMSMFGARLTKPTIQSFVDAQAYDGLDTRRLATPCKARRSAKRIRHGAHAHLAAPTLLHVVTL